MKLIFTLILTLIIITSCSETYDLIDPTKFNQAIAKRTDIETPDQLIKIYYDFPPNEGEPFLEIKSEKLNDGKIKVILIHDLQQDDAQRATKIVMIAELKNQRWKVYEIKTNRKCQEGRGHTDWGTAWCN